MSKPTIAAPVIETVETDVKDEAQVVEPVSTPTATFEVLTKNQNPAIIPFADAATIKVADIINAKGTFVSDSMIARIDQHLRYLTGSIGFSKDDDRFQEQITFMETIGNSTELSIDQYCIVTDYLLKTIRENMDAFKDGAAFRFMRGLNRFYSETAQGNYKNYITMLLRIAGAYANRKNVFKQMDVETITKDMKKASRDNVSTYMRNLCS